MAKKVLFSAMVILDLLLLHMVGGYIYRALSAPKLIGPNTAHFIGYYYLAVPVLFMLIVSGVLTVVLGRRAFIRHTEKAQPQKYSRKQSSKREKAQSEQTESNFGM